MKYDISSVVSEVQKLYNKEPSKLDKIGIGTKLKTLADGNFLTMPEWWQKATNTKGIPYGAYVMIAGDSDSGKTSAAISAMKAAQHQDAAVLYVETENKTTKEDLESWGVDPNIMLVKSSIIEEAFDLMFDLWDKFFERYPDGKLLVVFDSIGNIVSKHDSVAKLMDNQKPGGKGVASRRAINKYIAKVQENQVAGLIVNYTYDNIGSPGKTNAGGKALNLFSSMTYQTSRKQWLEKMLKGEKIRTGARVQWRLFKNHINKANPGPKVVELDITSKGITLAGTADEY